MGRRPRGRRGFRALSAGVVAVIATDEPVPDAERARFPGARFAHGADAVTALSRCDVVVRSPGISRYRDEVLELQAAGVQLTTATNLWFAEHHDEQVIGITGTKGKSTTASLVERLVTAAGAHAELAGNIGRPLLDLLHPQRPPDVWVVELSSYQAADLRFSPEVAVVVNLFREHVDWHGSEAVYYADKLNILRHRPRVGRSSTAATPASSSSPAKCRACCSACRPATTSKRGPSCATAGPSCAWTIRRCSASTTR